MKESDRGALPIPTPSHTGPVTYDAKNPDTEFAPIEPIRPPEGAPNVLVVLLDDVGFAASSAFGGPCHTPTAERLAAERASLQPFPHHRALLADAAALLTGRNHHRRNGRHHRDRHAAPGYNRAGPTPSRPLAEILRLNGYAPRVRQVARDPVWEVSPSGPTDRWPTAVRLRQVLRVHRRRDEPVAPGHLRRHDAASSADRTPRGYHFMTDMTDQAIEWIKRPEGADAGQAVLHLLRTGATHAPHHVPKEWIAKYKGKFDQGWDKLREETLARQNKLGVVPEDAKLTPNGPRRSRTGTTCPPTRSGSSPARWRSSPASREHTDHEIGRLVQALEDLGHAGQHAHLLHRRRQRRERRGRPEGLFNETASSSTASRRDRRDHASKIDDLGGPSPTPTTPPAGPRRQHAVPMDEAGRLALRRHPQRHGRPLAARASRPRARSARSAPRHRHRADGPRSGRPARAQDRSTATPQTPIDGVSMALHVRRRRRPKDRHTTQYFEMFGNRGIYHDGWSRHRHSVPWLASRDARLRRRSLGALPRRRTGLRRTTWPQRNPRSSRSCSACS